MRIKNKIENGMRRKESQTKALGINQEKSRDQWVTQKSLKKDTLEGYMVSNGQTRDVERSTMMVIVS